VTAVAGSTEAIIDQLVRTTGAADAVEAVRIRARELVDLAVASFDEATKPPEIDVLASLRGIVRSDERPTHSPDAELVPDGSGGVAMRVNPDRPETRQRFSVAHEVSHTFFPNYTTKVWCRTDARFRDRDKLDDYLEMLCDIGAAELLFPYRWFPMQAATVDSAAGLLALAVEYRASREATLRRFAELSSKPVAAVFFTWKLKPTQKGTIGRTEQTNLFGITPEEEIREALRLRIDYAIVSPAFGATGHFLPRDKSVENDGPIYEAAASGRPCDGECHLDLGQAAGRYRVHAVPLWTPTDELGANGEHAIAAIIRPVNDRKPKKKVAVATAASLFE
jgi:Zn-dependent peptidase ImmA (M78 family)